MGKFKISTVLVKDANIKPVKLKSASVKKIAKKTQEQQTEILKFKVVDQDNLKRVIQF